MTMMMVPRPFQSRAMEAVGQKLREGARGVCLVSPTGSGKTFMGAMMVARLVASGKRIAWGAHRDELITQAARTLKSFRLDVGMDSVNPNAPVQLGSFQSWTRRGSAPVADYFIPDECHHLGDKIGWQRISRGYLDAGARIIGLTATPSRGDGRPLPDFDALVVAAQIADLQRDGLLVPIRWRGPRVALTAKHIAQDPVNAYMSEAAGRCAVVFAPNLKSSEQYKAGFSKHNIPALIVEGKQDSETRRKALAAHASGEVPVLISVAVLTEGWDNPRCDCVIVARGSSAPLLWIQMTGRGLRPYPGKKDCLLLDLRGLAHVHGRPDAEATYSLDGAGIVLKSDATSLGGERLCKVCHAPLGDEIVCIECGKDHSPPVPKATNEALTDWEEKREAAKAALQPGKLVLALAGIFRKRDEAAQKGKPWKRGAAEFRFSIIFKRRPYANEIASAEAFNCAADKYEVSA